ncbi:rCG59892, partial [Rattus norvegicus]
MESLGLAVTTQTCVWRALGLP